jgi:hypothetical protein
VRAQELAADGWELLGVHFERGVWLFRRARRSVDEAPPLHD